MRKLIGFAVALALAGTALAQDSKVGYSNAPTNKDYKITIVEPRANATITGTDVQIVVRGVSVRHPSEDLKQTQINTPTFQVFVDGKDFGNIPNGQNVFVARNLSYGPHKIAVVAKNISGELVDRMEIPVTTVEATASSTTTISEPPPAPAPAPVAEAKPEPAPAPAPEPPPPPAPQTLPQTGSVYPIVALLGVLLVGSGVILRKS